MFKAIILSSLAVFAAAHDGPAPTTVTTTVTVTAPAATVTTIAQCNTGDAQCCNTVGATDSIPIVGSIFGLLDIVLDDLSVIVGLGCTPITILGLCQGANYAQQPVCCSNNSFNGFYKDYDKWFFRVRESSHQLLCATT
ncbi:hypothetical protein M422DRAFT_255535 [Sphaerobolus stellatus SS14]|uniref:Hydrophobin n=1 Tax=Sphaerobolus stellatus (strain SS14) TaxID=990650 RepID=A0A0C9UEC1_SPHS4|nr:hypothetical protein M422DRAFT_255535 [Sphaerobolus stellatus SS14]